LNDNSPILSFDLDLRLRDERCALIYVLRMCATGKFVLKQCLFTSTVQLKRDDNGRSNGTHCTFVGVPVDFTSVFARNATCEELGVDADILKVRAIEHDLFQFFHAASL
jgi:hypothetical protein